MDRRSALKAGGAELEVKGVRHPVRWACRQRLNGDGSLSLRPTAGLGSVI